MRASHQRVTEFVGQNRHEDDRHPNKNKREIVLHSSQEHGDQKEKRVDEMDLRGWTEKPPEFRPVTSLACGPPCRRVAE